MFRFLGRFASRRAPSARRRALAALAARDFASAERAITALLEPPAAPSPLERGFLLNKRGVARAGMDRLDDARGDFAAALECVANYPPALTNLGNLLLEEGRPEAAIDRYEAAIASDPRYAVAHLNLAAAYKRVGRVDEAVRSLRRAQQIDGAGYATFLRPRRPR